MERTRRGDVHPAQIGILVRLDTERSEPMRDAHGFCVRCISNEADEAIGRISSDPTDRAMRFDGYSDGAQTEKKILRNVFEAGDAWYRTGDLMCQDENGFYFFVDRIGDTFRW